MGHGIMCDNKKCKHRLGQHHFSKRKQFLEFKECSCKEYE
jgi:hypothetical protein